jgi:hypothetical protein
MLQIETNKGDKGLDVTGLSSNKHEDETLLPRNAKMEVIGVHPKITGAAGDNKGQIHKRGKETRNGRDYGKPGI